MNPSSVANPTTQPTDDQQHHPLNLLGFGIHSVASVQSFVTGSHPLSLLGFDAHSAASIQSFVTGGHWLQWAEDQIKESFLRPPDWDGQGSPQVSDVAARRAIELVKLFAGQSVPQPRAIGPNTDGGISVEWSSDFWDLVLELDADGHLDGWYRTPDGEYCEI